MSSYHSSFKYLNKKSDEDFGWIIAHFDPDNGETDSYLSQEQIYSDSYNGTKRTLYGTKYNAVANVKITVIKQDGSDFTLDECRAAYRWLTGNPEASWMDLYIGDEVRYRLLCTIQDVKPQKMDARTVGLNIYCESLSPWAYSPNQQHTYDVTQDGAHITIDCPSDDMYTYVYAKTTYENSSANSVIIQNKTTSESTEISNLAANEVITLDGNMLITSDKPGKIFGNSFNFVWPRFKSGENELVVKGDGQISFEYSYAIKIGDCATNINVIMGDICDGSGNIIVSTLPWDRISNTPTTLQGYGITDSYTKHEVDDKFANIDIPEVDAYTKQEVDDKIAVLESQIADLLYEDITITSFINNIGTAEKGRVVDVVVSWKTSKSPVAITLDGSNLSVTSQSHTYSNVSTDKTCTLSVTGERGEKATSKTTVSFFNGVYYGALVEPSTYDSNFILSLSGKTLSRNKLSTFTATAGDGQYIYYCLPTSMGACSFTVGGFAGGFTLVDTIEFTNIYNHSESYYIYRSDYPNLGTKKVLVS